MAHVIQDVTLALRRFRQKPLYSIGACALLALAVGGSTAIFAIVNAVMLRPLPLRQASDVVALHVNREGTNRGSVSLPMFLSVANTPRTLSGAAAYFQWSANLTDDGDAERLQAMRVTANYFDVIGADAQLGRVLSVSDGAPSGGLAAMISDGLWRRRFGSAPDIVGRSVRLNGDAFTIVGVLRPDFPFQIRDTELIAAWAPESDARRTNPALTFLRVVGRIAPGSTIDQARAELDARLDDFRAKYPEAGAADRGARVVSLRADIVGDNDRLLKMLAGAVALVLLIAAANLTNLLLVNSAGRLQEFSARRALGASSARLVAQLLTEAGVLAVVGGVLGGLLARLSVAALFALNAAMPRAAEVSIDAAAIAFAAVLSFGVSMAAAALPAIQLAFLPVRSMGGQRAVTLGGSRLRAWFVCAEVALSVLLVIGAGLLVRSFSALQRVEPGFQPSGVLSLRLSLPRGRYPATANLARFYDELAPRVQALPGVSGVAAANVVPMNGYLATATIQIPGMDNQSPKDWPDVHYRMVSPGYMSVMGIPLKAGRQFTAADNAAGMPVVIVSSNLAQRYWPAGNAVGAAIRIRDDNNTFRTAHVVGIAGDVRHLGLEAESPRELYVPIPQVPDGTSVWLANNMYWVVKTGGNPMGPASAVRQAVASVDAGVASSFVRPMNQWLAQSVEARRFNLSVIFAFAVTALLLAAVGVYGVAAEAVALRTREIGLRAALGASDPQLTAVILKGGLWPVAGGIALGAAAALAMTGTLSSFLFGVSATDPTTFLSVVSLVAAVGALAVYVPARRVTRIDPVIALRAE